MPKINVEHKSTLPVQEAVVKIKNFFETDKDISKLDPEVSCTFPSGKNHGKVTGSRFNADIKVHSEGSGCKINVAVDLPFILSPFKGKVEEMIRKKLAKFLA